MLARRNNDDRLDFISLIIPRVWHSMGQSTPRYLLISQDDAWGRTAHDLPTLPMQSDETVTEVLERGLQESEQPISITW